MHGPQPQHKASWELGWRWGKRKGGVGKGKEEVGRGERKRLGRISVWLEEIESTRVHPETHAFLGEQGCQGQGQQLNGKSEH